LIKKWWETLLKNARQGVVLILMDNGKRIKEVEERLILKTQKTQCD